MGVGVDVSVVGNNQLDYCSSCMLTLNLLAPNTVGARINPYPANVEKMVS